MSVPRRDLVSLQNTEDVDQRRRELLIQMGTGLVVLTVANACGEQVSPARARATRSPLRRLTDVEGVTLEALGDVLLPGAASAGIAHYVDDQLGSPTPLLMLRYVDYPGPFLDFYQQGLGSLQRISLARQGRPFHQLGSEQMLGLVQEMAQKDPPQWSGPPAPLFYFVTRSDAIDVCYGTPEGFSKLGIPYMAHIQPQTNW